MEEFVLPKDFEEKMKRLLKDEWDAFIDCYENEMGLVSIKLKSGDTGHIEVKYEMSKLHKICLCISLTTMTMYIGYLGYNLIKKRKI